MFRIGEFSKIAQVSGRLLRYYDEIGLLKPQYIDKWTNYRYYTADQLGRLNRILALKELGLSLNQIRVMLDEDIDTDAIRQLYLQRKSQIEQTLRDEYARLQQVQLRLNLLNDHDQAWLPDIVIKQVATQPVLTYRQAQMSGEQFFELFDLLSQKSSRLLAAYGPILTVMHADVFTPEEAMDLEIGLLLNDSEVPSMTLTEGVSLSVRHLPKVEHMATIVHQGWEDHPLTYNALGRWLEQHQYHIVGPGRELVLENYYPEEPERCVMEIQFPIEQFNVAEFDFLAPGAPS